MSSRPQLWTELGKSCNRSTVVEIDPDLVELDQMQTTSGNISNMGPNSVEFGRAVPNCRDRPQPRLIQSKVTNTVEFGAAFSTRRPLLGWNWAQLGPNCTV